jgi:hypothetical protein
MDLVLNEECSMAAQQALFDRISENIGEGRVEWRVS